MTNMNIKSSIRIRNLFEGFESFFLSGTAITVTYGGNKPIVGY